MTYCVDIDGGEHVLEECGHQLMMNFFIFEVVQNDLRKMQTPDNVYVCVHVCIHVCVYKCWYISMTIKVQKCVCVCVCVYMFVCMSAGIFA